MEAINFIKDTHKPFIGDINNNVIDEDGHDYWYYYCMYDDKMKRFLKSKHLTYDKLINTNKLLLKDSFTFLKTLPNVKELNIDTNGYFDKTFDYDMPNLKKLSYCYTYFNIPNLNELECLTITRCKNVVSSNFRCPNLKKLVISYTRNFTLPQLQHLESITIKYCNNFTIPFMPNLKSLELRSCDNVKIHENDNLTNLNIDSCRNVGTSKLINVQKYTCRNSRCKLINVMNLKHLDCDNVYNIDIDDSYYSLRSITIKKDFYCAGYVILTDLHNINTINIKYHDKEAHKFIVKKLKRVNDKIKVDDENIKQIIEHLFLDPYIFSFN